MNLTRSVAIFNSGKIAFLAEGDCVAMLQFTWISVVSPSRTMSGISRSPGNAKNPYNCLRKAESSVEFT